MAKPDNLWICIVYIKGDDDDYAAEFLIDARLYVDDAAARAVVSDANAELQRHSVAAWLDFTRVSLDQPVPELPSWDEYRRRAPHNAGGAQ